MHDDKQNSKKLAIIGASYLQLPLIKRANEMSIETHVFSWGRGEEGEKEGDYFYPISIVEKDEILKKCIEIGIDGICSIASDLASITVNYVASQLGLVCNGMNCTKFTTDKVEMRERFRQKKDPIPNFVSIKSDTKFSDAEFVYPLIVKPADRSGSRGVTKVYNQESIEKAIDLALKTSFNKTAIVEEFICGREYSVEFISWRGKHTFLAITQKFTTGSPHYIETGHLEPAILSREMELKIRTVVAHALDSLEITNGASHSEVMVTNDGEVFIVEIGARMGGDLIGSSLVPLTTGVDFVGNVIRIALNMPPQIDFSKKAYALVRFIFTKKDINIVKRIEKDSSDILVEHTMVFPEIRGNVTDSSKRFGYYLLNADTIDKLTPYFPY